jgi:site-specific recombinase XerD
MHHTIDTFIEYLRVAGREESARSYASCLSFFDRWLSARKRNPLTATTDDLRAYQCFLADEYHGANGQLLGKGTQATRLACVKSFYNWMHRRALVVADVAQPITIPRVVHGMVNKDHLTLQEATALLQTKAKTAATYPEGCNRWADQVRDLAFLCLALASGRRRGGLRHLKTEHADFARNELRCEREKGKAGRVLPVAPWAMHLLRLYVERARPILNWHRDNDWLFVGDRKPRIGKNTIAEILKRAHAEAVAANPDLTELADKHLSPHSLRVSFAAMLFRGGANIRTINELMLHESLDTTARYTPVPLDDLRRTCLRAHPMA